MKAVSMQQIADKLGVSKVSVSKAINNQPGISVNLKGRILRTAAEMGYEPTEASRSQGTSNLAFIVPKRFFLDTENFYTTIYYYLNREIQKADYRLTIFVLNINEEKSGAIPEMLTTHAFDGVFVAGEIDGDYLNLLDAAALPMIFIDFYQPHLQKDCVLSDNYYNGYFVTQYLIERGHTDIGFAGSSVYTTSILDRFFGYQKALYAAGIPFDDSRTVSVNHTETGLYTLDFKLPQVMPTAFVCHCDMAAHFLIQRLQAEGYTVPGDVSLISFDNTSLSENTTPPLTTIDINKKAFSKEAFRLMKNRLANPVLPSQRVYIHGGLVERASVGGRTVAKMNGSL